MSVHIQPIERSDIDEFIKFRASHFGLGGRKDEIEWLISNPFLDDINIFVAISDDEIIGGRAIFPIPLRVGGEVIMGLQSSGVLVHPDHRGKGIFSQLNQYIEDYYRDEDTKIFFAFSPSNAAMKGYQKHNLRPIENDFYIKFNSNDIFGEDFNRYNIGAGVITPINNIISTIGGFSYRYTSTITSNEIKINKKDDPPIDLLTKLYNQNIPNAIHGYRTREFYNWRLSDPLLNFTTYVAEIDEEPVMAATVSSQEITYDSLLSNIDIREIVPLEIPEDHKPILYHLLRYISQDVDADYFSSSTILNGKEELLANGFLPQNILTTITGDSPIFVKTINSNKNYYKQRWGFSLMERDH